MRGPNLKKIALKGLGLELANDVGVAGRYLYHQGYELEEIASSYKVSKEELLITIYSVLVEIHGVDWLAKMSKHC